MKFKKIKNDYIEFKTLMQLAYCYISELTPAVNKFLYNYCKKGNKFYSEKFAYELEINLLYFEKFLNILDDIFDDFEKINIEKMKIIKIKPFKRWNILEPVKYFEEDIDILVEKGATLDWSKII